MFDKLLHVFSGKDKVERNLSRAPPTDILPLQLKKRAL